MEIKIAGAMDLQIAEILDELKIRPASFSKYGRGYEMLMAEGYRVVPQGEILRHDPRREKTWAIA